MHQAGTVTREFAREFEQHSQDSGMDKQDAKVHLVSALNQDTLTHLDTYITMRGGNKMAHLETIQDQLHHREYLVSWPDKGLGVLCLWPMGVESARPPMPWMMLVPRKLKQLALLAS